MLNNENINTRTIILPSYAPNQTDIILHSWTIFSENKALYSDVNKAIYSDVTNHSWCALVILAWFVVKNKDLICDVMMRTISNIEIIIMWWL